VTTGPTGMNDEHLDDQRARFDQLLESARKDVATVSPEGKALGRLVEGVVVRELVRQVDRRGSVMELFDPRWGWHDEPLASVGSYSIRPNVVKGWHLHRHHQDRITVLRGELELVLYDVRPGSATFGDICRVVLSGSSSRLVNVPENVWHAEHNIGPRDVVVINFPTAGYNHADPDKYRLPVDTPHIPFSFGNAVGG